MQNASTSGDLPHEGYFSKRIAGAHAVVLASGVLNHEGGALVKAKVGLVRVESDEGSAEYATGETASPTPGAHEVVIRWVSVEYEQGSLVMESPQLVTVAAREVPILRVDGALNLVPTSGTLRTSANEYEATGERETLRGNFVASLSPTPRAEATSVTMRGTLDAASIVAKPVPLSERVGASSWLGGAVALAAVSAGGGALAVLLKRHDRAKRAMPPKVASSAEAAEWAEDDAAEAIEAALIGDWLVARALMERALRTHPDHEPGDKELGAALLAVGHAEEAIVHFERAALKANDGDAQLGCALASVMIGDFDLAEEYALDALACEDLHPDVLMELASHKALSKTRERPIVRDALDDATRRVIGFAR